MCLWTKIMTIQTGGPAKRGGGGENRATGVRAALESLSPQQRIVIELRHFQDMTYEEISRATRLSVNQVKTHLYRGRRILARKLTRDV